MRLQGFLKRWLFRMQECCLRLRYLVNVWLNAQRLTAIYKF